MGYELYTGISLNQFYFIFVYFYSVHDKRIRKIQIGRQIKTLKKYNHSLRPMDVGIIGVRLVRRRLSIPGCPTG